METLNNAQKELLKLFRHDHSEKELAEIKQLISEYLFKKAITAADTAAGQLGYTSQVMEDWSHEHYRTKK